MSNRIFYATKELKIMSEPKVVVSRCYTKDRQELMNRVKPAPGTYSLGFYSSRIGDTILVRDLTINLLCLKWRGTDRFYNREVHLKDVFAPKRFIKNKRSVGINTSFRKSAHGIIVENMTIVPTPN